MAQIQPTARILSSQLKALKWILCRQLKAPKGQPQVLRRCRFKLDVGKNEERLHKLQTLARRL